MGDEFFDEILPGGELFHDVPAIQKQDDADHQSRQPNQQVDAVHRALPGLGAAGQGFVQGAHGEEHGDDCAQEKGHTDAMLAEYFRDGLLLTHQSGLDVVLTHHIVDIDQTPRDLIQAGDQQGDV